MNLLILSASVGMGHDAAATAVAHAVEPCGHSVTIADGLAPLSNLGNQLICDGYSVTERHMPRAWGLLHNMLASPPGEMAMRAITGRYAGRLLPLIERHRPNLIVSTYPLVSAALDQLATRNALDVPFAVVISDYALHPLWTARHAAVQLVQSPASLSARRESSGNFRVAMLPTRASTFDPSTTRARARELLRLPSQTPIALVTGGSLGIGAIEDAAQGALMSGFYPVIVAGHNRKLHARLKQRFANPDQARALGWTGDLLLYLKAADCLVQNAGGVTCLEAIQLGTPVVLHRPIPGHGVANARIMAVGGVAVVSGSRASLASALHAARAHGTPVIAGDALRRQFVESLFAPFAGR